jgi:hypothetical protein
MASSNPGSYQAAYNKTNSPTRKVTIKRNNFNIEWLGDEMFDAMRGVIIEELVPVFEKMGTSARALVHTGGSPRDPRSAYKSGAHSGQPYTSRTPGRLRESIQTSVVSRTDRKAILGILEAGGDMADYAFVEELGVPGRKGGSTSGHAFLRPSFAKHLEEAKAAITNAINKL